MPTPIKKRVVSNPSKEISCLKSEDILENVEAILNQFIAYTTLANSKLETAQRLVLFGSLNNKVNPYIGYRIYAYTTIREDLDAITSILYQVFEMPSFKRDYDTAFGDHSHFEHTNVNLVILQLYKGKLRSLSALASYFSRSVSSCFS
jgi:hypothetical protein